MGQAQPKIKIYVDPDFQDLVPGFLENRRRETSKLQAALEQNQLDAVRVIGHDMKGMGSGYGFDGITEIGAVIEKAAEAGNKPEIAQQIERLKTYLESVEVIYDAPQGREDNE
jgi:chemotaxis protein histidine kinase CheA